MSTGSVSPDEIYRQILDLLEQRDADGLAQSIRTAVSRGVVLDADQHTSSKTFRPMEANEALAVALSLLVSAVEVPLMSYSACKVFNSKDIALMQEANEINRDVSMPPALNGESIESLRIAVRNIIDIVSELKLPLRRLRNGDSCRSTECSQRTSKPTVDSFRAAIE